jgi:hypothetical protein
MLGRRSGALSLSLSLSPPPPRTHIHTNAPFATTLPAATRTCLVCDPTCGGLRLGARVLGAAMWCFDKCEFELLEDGCTSLAHPPITKLTPACVQTDRTNRMDVRHISLCCSSCCAPTLQVLALAFYRGGRTPDHAFCHYTDDVTTLQVLATQVPVKVLNARREQLLVPGDPLTPGCGALPSLATNSLTPGYDVIGLCEAFLFRCNHGLCHSPLTPNSLAHATEGRLTIVGLRR